MTAGSPVARPQPIGMGPIPLTLVLLRAAALRLVSLNYSHFQGDEVQALYPIGASFPGSLLEQLKGPVQLLVTLAVRQLTGGYVEGQTRLPFSLASLLGVYVVYLVVRDAFGRHPALWAAALVGSCGLLVAFGRIVQYQAFVMLAVSLTALWLMRWAQRDEPRLLYFGFACFAFGVLSHYDALTFLPASSCSSLSDFAENNGRGTVYATWCGRAYLPSPWQACSMFPSSCGRVLRRSPTT